MLGVLAAPDLAARLCRDIKALFTELLPAARRHESALAVGSIDGEPGHCLRVCTTEGCAGSADPWCDADRGAHRPQLLRQIAV
jgi:hypothetical protein